METQVTSLENLSIEGEKGTFFTPHVNFNAETGVCVLEGESYLEDTWEFYEKLLNWLKSYAKTEKPIVFELKLTYFNTSSSKGILDLLKFLKSVEEEGKDVTVNWYHPEDDEDNIEEAEDFREDTGLDIQLIAY
ncbi:DUF1987 domain-containing protein [Flexithrix dorotheae]|uniref:DUF1987 domain-containing protein n=1 Tax=Flexithrix dorotheae TaxID=70993 RepID=UPI00037F7BB0|nr:DUF1987 domain-containing protein [Flexithrix dorotheae]